MSRLRFTNARFHRNGSFGEGFYTVRFADGRLELGAVVFDGAGVIAILDDDGQSYRPEVYEAPIRAFLASDAGLAMCWPFMRDRHANDNRGSAAYVRSD